ncbi:hypothetical protein H0G86_008779 [Trichoderma simmonsii]|uniref:Uncharacterized protein n=1 Tax=Trichoderma simmonsii TaxID=1491479 RepID=A0A8G0LG84_9HYPO|nr:hypothetical protein H0G86_008779 [Trichoderma simmonsii]
MRALDEAARGMGHDLSHAWMLRIQRGFGENPMWLSFLSSLLETEKLLEDPDLQGGLKLREELTQKQRRWLAAELVSTVIAQLPNLDHLSLCVLPYSPGDCAPPSALEVLGISSLRLKTVDIALDASDIDMGLNLEIRLRGLLRWSQQLTTINLHKCSATFSLVPILSLPRLSNIRMTETRIANALLGLADAVMSQKHNEERQFSHLSEIQCDFTPMMDKWGISKVLGAAGIRFLYGDSGS